MTTKNNPPPQLVVHAYTREEALADEVLIDVSPMAWEAGITLPTAMTAAVWHQYVLTPEACPCQSEHGRLWDILFMLRRAILNSPGGDRVAFQVLVENTPHRRELVTLKAVCGPSDDAEAVITIMLPHED